MPPDPDTIPDSGAGPAAATPPPKKRGRPRKAKADRAPRKEASGAAKRSEKKAGEIRLVREAFTEVLTAPSMIAAAKGDEWAVDHFTTAGAALADRLAVECERNDALRARLVKMAGGSSYLMLGTALGAYLLPPLIHYNLIPGLPGMGDVPRRNPPPAGPSPGAVPPFHQPPRPPAPPEPPPATTPTAADVHLEADPLAAAMPIDPLAAELAAEENGGVVPPPPVESV